MHFRVEKYGKFISILDLHKAKMAKKIFSVLWGSQTKGCALKEMRSTDVEYTKAFVFVCFECALGKRLKHIVEE